MQVGTLHLVTALCQLPSVRNTPESSSIGDFINESQGHHDTLDSVFQSIFNHQQVICFFSVSKAGAI
jgi:hypothetical protein